MASNKKTHIKKISYKHYESLKTSIAIGEFEVGSDFNVKSHSDKSIIAFVNSLNRNVRIIIEEI